jgi:adenylate cyclase
MTKQLDCRLIVSEEVCRNAGIGAGLLAATDVSIRGRDKPLAVRTAADPTVLESLLDPIANECAEEMVDEVRTD